MDPKSRPIVADYLARRPDAHAVLDAARALLVGAAIGVYRDLSAGSSLPISRAAIVLREMQDLAFPTADEAPSPGGAGGGA